MARQIAAGLRKPFVLRVMADFGVRELAPAFESGGKPRPSITKTA
jgi:hypothetical protein